VLSVQRPGIHVIQVSGHATLHIQLSSYPQNMYLPMRNRRFVYTGIYSSPKDLSRVDAEHARFDDYS
jgi:hypothetical protein